MLKSYVFLMFIAASLPVVAAEPEEPAFIHMVVGIAVLVGFVWFVTFIVKRFMKWYKNGTLLVGFTVAIFPLLFLLTISALNKGKTGEVIFFGFLSLSAGSYLYDAYKKRKVRKSEDVRIELALSIREKIRENGLFEAYPSKEIIKEGETAHYSCPASLREYKTTGYEAGGASVRVRVAKGVSVGLGGGTGRAKKDYVITSVGELVVTNKRIVFAGDNKSFEIPLIKLVSYEVYRDGIGLHSNSKSYTLILEAGDSFVAEEVIEAVI